MWHDPGPGQNVTYAYGYDAVSRVTSMTAASGTNTLAYDGQSRLTRECGPQVVATTPDHCYHWSYDQDGNLLTAADDNGAGTDLYTYTNRLQPDQQTAGGSTTSPATATLAFGYDASGNTTSISNPVALTDPSSASYTKDARNDSFGYDSLGRVTRVTRLVANKDGTVTPLTATIAYNAAGQRSEYLLTPAPGEGNAVDTRYTYRGGELAQAAVTGAGLTPYTNTFVYRQDGTPYELIRSDPTGTSRYWYSVDGLGSVVALTDVTGKVADRYGYDSWGEPITDDRTNETAPQQLRYRGAYYDEKLTYYWMDGRYYDPEAARYLQPSAPNADDYVYAGDNPLNMSGTAAGSRGVRPHTSSGGCIFLIAAPLTTPVCFGNDNPVYMLLIGDDLETLGSDQNFVLKGIALIDVASNLALVIPGGGEAARFGVKGAAEAVIRIAGTTGAKGGGVVLVRSISKGERITDLIQELSQRTYETGREHAIVSFGNGSRAVVRGEYGNAIDLPGVKRLIVHTHSPFLEPTMPSAEDYDALQRLGRVIGGQAQGQTKSWILQHGRLYRFRPNGAFDLQDVPGR